MTLPGLWSTMSYEQIAGKMPFARAQLTPQTDGRTDRQTDGKPISLVERLNAKSTTNIMFTSVVDGRILG